MNEILKFILNNLSLLFIGVTLVTLLISAFIKGVNWRLIKEDSKRLPVLFMGFILLSFGIYLTKISLLGMSSWSVFHDGFAKNLEGISFGEGIQIIGFSILLVSMIFLKTKIGLGTVFNILVVGPLIDVYDSIYATAPDEVFIRFVLLLIGILATTLGRSIYIASRLGPGPRDGLFVGLARITHFQVKYVKISIEFVVLGIGILLGGQTGIGTAIIIVVSGYLVQFFFKLFHFDPKSVKQSNMFEYVIK